MQQNGKFSFTDNNKNKADQKAFWGQPHFYNTPNISLDISLTTRLVSSEIKQMNDNRYYQREERVKHIRIKEFHSLNIYYKDNHFVKSQR